MFSTEAGLLRGTNKRFHQSLRREFLAGRTFGSLPRKRRKHL
jgi:hypothetical protein